MFAFLIPSKPVGLKPVLEKKDTAEDLLVEGIRQGNNQSIKQAYKMYSPALFGIIMRIVKFDEVAEDVLQDTFVKIWKSIHQYDSSKGRFFTWIANLARNTAIDQLRSKASINTAKTDELFDATVESIDRKTSVQLNIDAIGVKNLIRSLKPDQMQIVDIIYFQGYTHVQAAELLNIPLGTIKTKLRHSILLLRGYFKETKRIA